MKDASQQIRRFCRKNAEDVARFKAARRMSELETRAREWIARGYEANIQLGHTFILLKKLLRKLMGHGHFEDYYEKKFGKPYGIAFRTAQAYMQLARQEDEAKAKGADPALFAKAMDSQAVAMRDATVKAKTAAAKVKQRSEQASASTDDNLPRSKGSGSSLVPCRLHLRTIFEHRTPIYKLWKSKHRRAAELAAIEVLLELCEKHHISGTESASEDEA